MRLCGVCSGEGYALFVTLAIGVGLLLFRLLVALLLLLAALAEDAEPVGVVGVSVHVDDGALRLLRPVGVTHGVWSPVTSGGASSPCTCS